MKRVKATPNSVKYTEKWLRYSVLTLIIFLPRTKKFYINANEKYGATGAQQAKALMQEVTGLFAGGELDQDDMDEMMKAIQDAYWIAKEKNKKYASKG